MNKPLLNPVAIPTEWHRYLYRSILLPWETLLKHRKGFPLFNRRKPVAGINLIKMDHVHEVRQTWENSGGGKHPGYSLCFYSNSNNAALKDLLGLLRNCVAHGHYAQGLRKNELFFWHEYQGKLKLFGNVSFSSLKKLIEFIETRQPV